VRLVQTHPNPLRWVPRLVYLTNIFYLLCTFTNIGHFPFSTVWVHAIQMEGIACVCNLTEPRVAARIPQCDFFTHGATAPSGPGPHCLGCAITLNAHQTRCDSSGRVNSPTHRPLQENTQHSTFAIYHNAVKHTTGSAVLLKQGLLSVSCPNVSVHIWACTVWLSVIGLKCLLSLSWLSFHAHTVFKM